MSLSDRNLSFYNTFDNAIIYYFDSNYQINLTRLDFIH